jgi:RHS repeat-associated protein
LLWFDIRQTFAESGLSTRPPAANLLTNTIRFLILPAASAPAGLGDCRRTISTVRTEANEDKVISTTWQSVDGLRSRQETLGVANPATATRTKPLDGASTTTQTNPDGTSTTTETLILANGNTQTTTIFKDASSVILQTSTLVSDALGRTIQSTNGRGHVTQYAYHGVGGQTASITQVNAAPGGGDLVTSTSYTLTPGSGRLVTTTLPDGTSQYQESNLLGQTTRQWGSQTNPVSFTYDAAGNRATLTTYRAPVGANADTFPATPGDTTTWRYDPSGVLLGKRDAANQEVTYTYDIAGRVLTRTWARGVVTTYSYIAGQLTSTTYTNDPANTPAVSIAYDRLGRQVSQSNGLATTDYDYDSGTLALDTETVTIDPDGPGPLPALTRILDRSRDNLGREGSTGILPVSNGSAEHALIYGYDASGRLGSVTSPAGTFTYAYTPNSSLIASVTGPVHVVTNTWEPNRDVLDVKDNRIPSTTTPISRFDYGVNAIGQRTGVITTGSAFPSQSADWTWGYDALGQVTSADSPTNTFDRGYEYDQIGNRKRSADGALDTTGSTATVYDPNPLNQYDAIGSFSPTYDADGNQKDAQILPLGSPSLVSCVYHWDAENRLIAVKDTNNADIVTYTYDSQFRRVARTEGSNVTLYLYDEWNCLAEYTLHNSSFNLHTSLSWGLDLSGSLQGAGGVGGLLAVTKHEAQSATHFFPTYDGNGNVSEYLGAGGAISAHFEYDSFGRTIAATGSNVAGFVYRFSCKPVDQETGLYYYGYRWFDSETGRWMNRDPLKEKGGLNLYGFLGNSPLSRFDVLGLSSSQAYGNMLGKYLSEQGISPWDILTGNQRNININLGGALFIGPLTALRPFCDIVATATLHDSRPPTPEEQTSKCVRDVDLAIGVSCGVRRMLTSKASVIPKIGPSIASWADKKVPDFLRANLFIETNHVWSEHGFTWPQSIGIHGVLAGGEVPHSANSSDGGFRGGWGMYLEGEVTYDFASEKVAGDILLGATLSYNWGFLSADMTYELSFGEMLGWNE